MSENAYANMDWNTAEIRSFKAAFQKRTQASGFSALFVDNASTARDKALALVAKRKQHALATLTQVEAETAHRGEEIVVDLRQEADRLSQVTDTLTSFRPATDPQRDSATEALIAEADRWIALEGKCISARNKIKKVPASYSFDEKLLERAEDLLNFATTLKDKAKGNPNLPGGFEDRLKVATKNLTGLEQELENLKWELAEGREVSALHADDALVESRNELQSLASSLAEVTQPPDAVSKAALSSLYGVTVKTPEGPNPPAIPYKQLLDAFKLVPVDHVLTGAIKTIEFKKLERFVGGSYSDTSKTINLNVTFDLAREAEFINPETGKKDSAQSFAKTTLHEIGHSVDHAYGIMAANAKQRGCGGWTEVDPFKYVQAEFAVFEKKAAQALQGASEDVQTSVGESKPDFVNYMAGVSTLTEFSQAVRERWMMKELPKQRERRDLIQQSGDTLTERIKNFFDLNTPRARSAQRDRLGLLSVGCENAIDALTSGDPPVFVRKDLADRANAVTDDGTKLADWIDTTIAAYLRSLYQRGAAEWDRCQKLVEQSAPPPGELQQYGAKARPWTINTAGRTIGGQPASHQAYEHDGLWWQYDGGARQSTYVTDYQWRAPGEWFAELYAFTWLKEIDPPSGVGQSVRPYLYGGHIKPGQ